MTVANNPIFIEEVPGNGNDVRRGSTIKRTVNVKNIGDIKADVDIWISATDNKSDPLLRWCTFSEKNPLTINAKESKQITFSFEIPQPAIPDIYNYEILVEAASQYPGKIFRRPQQIRILPSDHDAEFGNEPSYNIQPFTTVANPLLLQAGEKVELKITVENHSKRVDRYYLNCAELNHEWYTISYPESNLNLPGLIKESDGLELNPGNAGEITLTFHPPQYTPAGNYFPTVNLVSSNTEDLVLLDVVYLQILPDYRLSLELIPLERKVPLEDGEFTLEIINHGNVQRVINIFVDEIEEIFSYHLETEEVELAPGQQQTVLLKAKPKKWWRRNFWKKDLKFNFDIGIENTPTATGEFIDLPLPKELPQGTLIWQPRPAWLLWLICLLCLGAITSVGIFLLLRYINSQKPSPQIVNVKTTLKEYQEYKEKDIPVEFSIKHPEQVEKFALVRLQGNEEVDRKNFSISDKIKDQIKDQINKSFSLENAVCKVSNETEKIANSQNNNTSYLTTGSFIKLPSYPSKPATTSNQNIQKINNLKCHVKMPNNQKAGTYTIKLEVFSKQNPQQVTSTQITDSFIVKPPILPIISGLSSTYTTYQEVNTELLQTQTLDNSLINSATSQNISQLPPVLKSPPILLNWQINNFNKIKELKLIGLLDDGSIGSTETNYLIINNNLPINLSQFCSVIKNNLVCNNVPTNAIQPGNYTFKLTVISQTGEKKSEIFKETTKIKILPKPPTPPIPPTPVNILSFTVNGQNVAEKPSFICELSENKVPNELSVAWQVQEGEDITVELSPFGTVSQKQDSLLVAVSQKPSNYLLTLKIKNKAGEQKTQGVIIETVEGPLTSLSKLPSCISKTPKTTPQTTPAKTPPQSTPAPTPTASPIPTATATPTPTATPLPTTSPTPTASPTPTTSPAVIISPVPTASPAVIISPVPTTSPTPIENK